MESGSPDNVRNIFKQDAQKMEEAVKRLGKTESADAVFPELLKRIEIANDNAISEANELVTRMVQEALGSVVPEIIERPVEVAPEAVEQIAIKPESEQLKEAAEEVIKENEDALQKFYGEHGEDPKKHSEVEQMYVQVLLAKHAEGLALLAYAGALLSGQPEDVIKPLDKDVNEKEAISRVLEMAYLNRPEMKDLSNANETGGSIGSKDFGNEPPASAPPAGPEGPGNQPPDLKAIQNLNVATSKEAAGMHFDTRIQTKIETYKGPDVGGPVEKGFFGNLVSKFIGWPGKKDRH